MCIQLIRSRTPFGIYTPLSCDITPCRESKIHIHLDVFTDIHQLKIASNWKLLFAQKQQTLYNLHLDEKTADKFNLYISFRGVGQCFDVARMLA